MVTMSGGSAAGVESANATVIAPPANAGAAKVTSSTERRSRRKVLPAWVRYSNRKVSDEGSLAGQGVEGPRIRPRAPPRAWQRWPRHDAPDKVSCRIREPVQPGESRGEGRRVEDREYRDQDDRPARGDFRAAARRTFLASGIVRSQKSCSSCDTNTTVKCCHDWESCAYERVDPRACADAGLRGPGQRARRACALARANSVGGDLAAVAAPQGVVLARRVDPLVGVGAEEIALALGECGREPFGAQGVVVRQ